MNVPPRVDAVLGDEDVAAHVPLKGEDVLFVTPSRTLHYTAEGLLSDESVTEYDHDAERVEVREGRRKSKIVLDYGLEGDAEIPVPGGKLNDALHPILAGVLNASGVTEPGETVKRTYRFSELTLVVTSHRVVKHVGNAVWDEEFEAVPFAEVTGIGVEEGNVASQLVLETTGRTQRIKAPNEEFRDVRETIEDLLFAFHDVSSVEEFRAAVAPEDGDESDAETTEVRFGGEPGLDASQNAEAVQEPEPDAGPDATGQPGATGADASTPGPVAGPEAAAAQAEAEPTADGAQAENDALAESGFEKASSKVAPQVDVDAVRTELDALEAELEAQELAIREQKDRLDGIRRLLPDE